MAEGTRFARLEEALSKLTALQESQANLIEKQHMSIDTTNNSLSELTVGLKTLDAKVEKQLQRNVTPVGPSSSPTPPFGNNQIPTQSSEFTPSAKTMRIDFPRFSGNHPSAWVARIQRMLKLGILLFLFLIQVVCASEVHSPPRLVTRLIHINSIQSPFYNPKYNNDDLAEIDLHGSLWDVFLHSSQHFGTMSTPVYPLRKSGFLVHLKVGQHKADQYLFLDTGSSLLWIHCRPDSLNARNPVYDSKDSSTYQAEDCRTSAFCDAYNFKCDLFQRCRCIQSYADGIKSKGHLAQETFVFGGTGGSLFGTNEVVLHGIVFGCSNATRLLADGILGFGNSTHSLLAQTSSSRFSYCLGDINDVGYGYNILIVGNPMKERLTHEIPLIVDGKYYIDITAIQIGRVILDIETDILKRNRYEHTGGMAVDTGSTLSFFPEVVYYPFAAAIRKLIDDLSLDRYYHDPAMLCYNGNFRRDLAEFPIVRLWFGKISYMEFRTGHLFQQMGDGIFCLAFKPSEDVNENFDFGIMGILVQQGYYISYNLQASTFSFESMDCSAFDNYIHDEL